MILSELVLVPLAGAFLILLLPKGRDELARSIAWTATGAVLALSVIVLCGFDYTNPGLQFVEQRPWIRGMDAWYFLGIDGINMALVFLSALLGFLCCAASASVRSKVKAYFFLYLVLMAGVTGVFLAQDLLLFFVFWEMVLIPIFFLISIWGGPGREQAAMKFFLYTLAGSVFLLLGIIGVYFAAEPHTFSMPVLAHVLPGLDIHVQAVLFLAFFLAFAVKLPAFPFHTWLPDAYVEAPAPVTVLMAGLLAKMGGYGLLRIAFPFFKDAAHAWSFPLAALGALTVLYGAAIAVSQKEFKRLVAYASVSHMGFVLIALAAMNQNGFNGALLEMFNHGIIIAGLFLLAGILQERSGTGLLSGLGGLWGQMPVFGFFLVLCGLATAGLPGLNGFVSEFLSLLGAFAAFPGLAAVAALALVVAAVYVLFMFGQILLGKPGAQVSGYADIGLREAAVLTPLAAVITAAGFYPLLVLRFQETAVAALTHLL